MISLFGKSERKIEGKTSKEWFHLGFEETNPEKEIEYFSKTLELNPAFEEAWYNKGLSLGKMGRYEEALECYDEALGLNSDNEEAWFNKGELLDKLGRPEEALICYNKALELNQDDAEAWFNKGELLNKLGKYRESVECYDNILRLNPEDDKASKNRELTKQKLEEQKKLKATPVIKEVPPRCIDIKSAFGYKGATILYKIKIENNTSKPVSDIRIYPYVPDVFLLKEKEKSISLIEPASSQTLTFEIRPTGECGNCNISGRVNYYDMCSMKRQDIELEPKSLSIVCPMLRRKEISDDAWRELVSVLVKAEETTTDIPIEGEGLFGMISEILKDINLFALVPSITKTQQIFRGTARFYGEGIKGLRYAAQIEVVGGSKKSKLILKTWAEKEDALTGFYHGLLDEIEKRVKVKDYIDDSIVQYNIHCGDKIGTQVKDSFVQRSNIGAGARKCPDCGREVDANEKSQRSQILATAYEPGRYHGEEHG